MVDRRQANYMASKKNIELTRRLYEPILEGKSSNLISASQLTRPQFKLIQDLTKSLITEARILRDVFSPGDFANKSAPDRKFKVNFCQRLIDFVAANGQPIASCPAVRVAAGSEPDKTHELLQALARLAQSRVQARNERRPRTFTRNPTSPAQSAAARSSVPTSASQASKRPPTRLVRPSKNPPTTKSDNLKQAPASAVADQGGARIEAASGEESQVVEFGTKSSEGEDEVGHEQVQDSVGVGARNLQLLRTQMRQLVVLMAQLERNEQLLRRRLQMLDQNLN